MIFLNPEELTNEFRDEEVSFEYLRQNSIPIESLLEDAKIENLIAPNLNDLARLLKVCNLTNPSKIIEFGCGFSSYIFHNYLINKEHTCESRNYLHIIEVHKKYMDIACNRFRKSNKNIDVINDICSVTTDIYRNDGSHKYLATYSFNPDIIYLDGPDPGDILNSKFFKDSQRVPISSDILSIEAWLIPGTIVIIDGRIANVEYLKSNLKRKWDWATNYENDCSIAILKDKPLGKKNIENLKRRGLIK